MAISGQQNINIGLPNESIGSDSLFTAFTKIDQNFTTVFDTASPYNTFVGGAGITASSNSTTGTVTITNTGVTNIIAGTNITINQSNGNVTISSTGGGNGGGGLTSVGVTPVSTSRLVVTNSPLVVNGNMTIDLAASGATAGSYSNPNMTIDTYGRVTSIANGSVAGTVTSVGLQAGPGVQVNGGPVTTSGNIVVTNTGVIKLTAGSGIDLSGSNGNVTISLAGGISGTVTSVGITSTSLVVAGGPITTSGTFTINLPPNPTISGNLTSGNASLGVLATASYFSGDGSNLTNILATNITGTVATATTADTVTTNAQPNITSVGTLSSLAVVASANPSLGNNVTANFFTGSGQNLSNIQGANVEGTVANASNATRVSTTLIATGTYYLPFLSATASANYSLNSNAAFSANIANGGLIATTFVGNVTGNVTGNVIGNVTGNLTGNVTGNISGNIVAAGANTQVLFNDAGNVNATSGMTFNKSTNLLTISGNISGGNLTTSGALSVTGNANVGNIGAAAGVFTANVTGGNLTTGGVLSVTGNANVGNLGTSGLISATGNVTGGNLVTGGVVSATGNISGANITASSYYIRSISTNISAAGTTQGNATALTKEINVISTVSSGQGVVLPTAIAGMVLIVNNTSASSVNVYPASGAAINSLSSNAAYTHPASASLQYYATSTTQWYTVGASYA